MSNKYDPPQTRVEAILLNMLGESYKLDPPQTRVELLLQAILEQGGGGGTEPVIKYKGVTTTPLTDGSTTNPVEIDGEEVTAETGDFVAYNGAEFIWNGTAWQELGDLELVAAIMTSIAPTYAESETYNTGDRVYYNDILYECIDDNVTGEFNPTKWDEISVTQVLSELENDIELVSSDIQAVSAMISDTYKTTSTYDVGDLVIYNKKLYRCNTANTTGAWNASKWNETSVAAQLNEIRSAISNLTDAVNGLIDDNSTSASTTWSSSKIEEEIDNKSVTKTATGNPIEFSDGADAPLVKCVTQITGSQDLHGYDKPWVGGAGKNKYSVTAGEDLWNNNVDATHSNDNGVLVINCTNGTYSGVFGNGVQTQLVNNVPVSKTVSFDIKGSVAATIKVQNNSIAITTEYQRKYITIPANTGASVSIYGNGTANTIYVKNMAITEDGSTSWEPYSNICPITAYTEGEIEVVGKNLYNSTDASVGYIDENGEFVSYDGFRASAYMMIVLGNTYTLSYNRVTAGISRVGMRIAWYDSSKVFIRRDGIADEGTDTGIKSTSATAPSNAKYARVSFPYNRQSTQIAENIQFETGSTATPYEPYTSTTHTTTFPSAIYRGSEDCVNGEVIYDMPVIDLGDLTWTKDGNNYRAPVTGIKRPATAQTKGNGVCSHYRIVPQSVPTVNTISFLGWMDGIIYWGDGTYETAADFTTAMNGVQLAYELATPTTSSVTPTNLPIKSLSGYNHIESTTGEMEVEYITEKEQPLIDLLENYADNAAEEAASAMIADTESSSTKTWSSNKISSEISSGDTSIRNNIASTYDPTKTYNVGNIVYQNNTLYRCFVDNTTGTWDATRWRTTTVAELIETLSAQPTSWDDVQALVRSGVAPQIFQIGDQLICQKDGVNIVWDVLAHNQDVPTDPTLTRSMTLGMHNIYAMMMFDNKEAAFATESGLTAGTYNFTVGQHPWVSADVGKTYQFTLTQDVPANGQIVFNNAYNATFNNATVSTYSDGTSTTAIESATMTEGSSGTSLGTINNAGTPASGINSIQRALLGSNNYKESAIRQWLNSDQVAGSVWTPQTKFDRPPDWRNSSKGFMNGLDADFKAVIGEITFNTARNTVSDGGGYDTMSDKFRLLARENVYAGKEVSTVDEGGVYGYYSKYSSYSSASTGADTNRIKRYNDSPNWWWLRSPYSGNARGARYIYSDGSLYDSVAVSGGGVVVACNVV